MLLLYLWNSLACSCGVYIVQSQYSRDDIGQIANGLVLNSISFHSCAIVPQPLPRLLLLLLHLVHRYCLRDRILFLLRTRIHFYIHQIWSDLVQMWRITVMRSGSNRPRERTNGEWSHSANVWLTQSTIACTRNVSIAETNRQALSST